MEITALLKSFIYVTSSALFVPVLLALTILTLWMVMYCGTFCAMWLQRRRLSREFDAIAALLQGDFTPFTAPVRAFAAAVAALDTCCHETAVINLLRDYELSSWKRLDTLKLVIRIGPGLGLIGTLIPMGTGLAALGQGNLTQLSGDLVIAFTTTVVGMALGLLSYMFFTIQRRWVEEDMKNMELYAEIIVGDRS